MMNIVSEVKLDLDILIKDHPQLLNIQDFIAHTKWPVDNLYVDLFWNTLPNNKENWIYLNEKIIDIIGFKGTESRPDNKYTDCYRLITSNFIKDEDYKIMNKKEFILLSGRMENKNENSDISEKTDGNRKKYYLLTPECLKMLLLKANTQYSDKVYKYYIGLEKLFWTYVNYQNGWKTYQLELKSIQSQEQLDLLKIESLNKDKIISALKEFNQTFSRLTKTVIKKEWIYILTNKSSAKKNIFKIGCTSQNVNKRLSSLNTGHHADPLYACHVEKCYDSKLTEYIIHNILDQFRREKEFFCMPYDLLKSVVICMVKDINSICQYPNAIIDQINARINDGCSLFVSAPSDIFVENEQKTEEPQQSVNKIEHKSSKIDDIIDKFENDLTDLPKNTSKYAGGKKRDINSMSEYMKLKYINHSIDEYRGQYEDVVDDGFIIIKWKKFDRILKNKLMGMYTIRTCRKNIWVEMFSNSKLIQYKII